ncbi:MAG: SIS domain-containing protein [Bacillota bacterium]
MHLTKKEILNQDKALEKSLEYLTDKRKEIEEFFAGQEFKSLTFIGSGSSFSLCRSAAVSVKMHTGYQAQAIAAGDLMLNFNHYDRMIKDTIIIAPSRSGNTTEVVEAVKQAQRQYNTPFVSISAASGSALENLSDLNLFLPWIFDESVCQTRTVTNLYMVQLYLVAVLGQQEEIITEIRGAVNQQSKFMEQNHDRLVKVAQKGWERAVVLADSELEGIGDEAAIAFKEIPQIISNYYHILDVRHGPMVLINQSNLVIMATTPGELSYQNDLIEDLQQRKVMVVSVGEQPEEALKSDIHVQTPGFNNYGVMGIPFIYVPQIIAYYKAVERNINPDKPKDLDPWIKL